MATNLRLNWIIAIALVGWLMYLLAPVLTPFVAAALLAYIGDPLADRLEKLRMPRTVAVVAVFILTFLLLGLLVLLVGPLIRAQVGAFLDAYLANHPDVALEWRMMHAMPGSRTEPDNWIIQSCWRALETEEGTTHEPTRTLSGTTDGNVLRNAGIPTVRLGLPGLVSLDGRWPPFFEACRVADFPRLVRVYIRAVIDTCTRNHREL